MDALRLLQRRAARRERDEPEPRVAPPQGGRPPRPVVNPAAVVGNPDKDAVTRVDVVRPALQQLLNLLCTRTDYCVS